jgi:DNA modification methylase
LIAAETVGRVCLAMELEPAYCDVIVERWQAFTGQSATRFHSHNLCRGAERSRVNECVDR